MQRALIGGIFVGGAGTRMGGRRKDLLRTASGETLRDRWLRLFAEVGVPTVFVGGGEAGALADEGSGAGPLGGLAALLAHAGDGRAISVACDMPFVTREMLEHLISAPSATVVAPKRDGRWEPFFAVWDARAALPSVRARIAARELALQGALDALDAHELSLDDREARLLFDWDTPEDVSSRRDLA